jgi:adenosine kinase
MGNPLLDISANVDQDFLDKYGFKLNNAILAEEKHQPCYEDMVSKYKVDYIAGGATQNSIRVAQWVLASRPGSTDYIGCVGKDKYGETLRDSAGKDGVRTHYMQHDEQSTGTCAVMVKDKERSLCANLAAANCYKIDHLKSEEVASKTWEKATHVYTAGFFLTVSPESINFVGKHCNETGKVFCMNLSAIFIVDFFTEKLMEALQYCDFLFGNESEAEAFGKKQGYEDLSISNIALELSKLKKFKGRSRTVVITQGAQPTVVARDGVVTEFPTPKLTDDQIVDSNGAGDSFVGGFLDALMSGKDLAECVSFGTMAAGAILGVSGCDLVAAGKPAKSL